MKASGTPVKEKKEGDDPEQQVPQLAEGEPLQCLEWLGERKETTPPPRYSEASLVRELEKNGVGRPSTYAQTVSTLQAREYVVREDRSLTPSELGMQVSRLLVASLEVLFNVKFTASMESSLDEIERGAVDRISMLKDFHERFKKWMAEIPPAVADRGTVGQVLSCLEGVREWAPPVKRGKRTYSDEKFVVSIRKQLDESKKEVSLRQLDALIRIAAHYRDQVPGLEGVLRQAGAEEVLKKPQYGPPRASSLVKLRLLEKVALNESTSEFVASLRKRAEGNRGLSKAQLGALDSVVLRYGKEIPGFEEIRAELEIGDREVAESERSRRLLDALVHVETWRPAVQRGKKVFDDHAFYESLRGYYESRGSLSVRQNAALARMVKKYRAQVPNYEELAEQLPDGKKGG